jgi:hypothetical protein
VDLVSQFGVGGSRCLPEVSQKGTVDVVEMFH